MSDQAASNFIKNGNIIHRFNLSLKTLVWISQSTCINSKKNKPSIEKKKNIYHNSCIKKLAVIFSSNLCGEPYEKYFLHYATRIKTQGTKTHFCDRYNLNRLISYISGIQIPKPDLFPSGQNHSILPFLQFKVNSSSKQRSGSHHKCTI